MREDILEQSHVGYGHLRLAALVLLLPVIAGSRLTAIPLNDAAQPLVPKSVATHSTPHKTTRARSAANATVPAPQPEPPPAPKLPDWPANATPLDATVVWNSQGLSIQAANSSLSQILKDVSTATGAKIQGMNADLRIFGSYGPGKARDVIGKLLEGSGYNVLLIGDQGQGTPREIILSSKPKGGASGTSSNQASSNDDSADDNTPPDQPEPPQPTPIIRNGFEPGALPRTPQQIMQEMQQRQQQMQQQPPSAPPQ